MTQLQCSFSVNTGAGVFLTQARVRLLETIECNGSISRAARQLGISYKWAWEEVNDMNGQAPCPLVVRSAGGKRGGGTALTPYGIQVVAFYRALEREYQHTVDELSAHVLDVGSGVNFRYLLRRRALAARECKHG